MEKEVILCAANSYQQKYYLNPDFEGLPKSVKEELQIMCVMFTEDVGGVIMAVFDEDGSLTLRTSQEEDDFTYDEIGSVLKIKEIQRVKRELFESLEKYFIVMDEIANK